MERTEAKAVGGAAGPLDSTDAEMPLAKRYIVVDEKGLHMRPLTELTQICQASEFSPLSLELRSATSELNKKADPRSIFELLLLAAERGATIEIRCAGCEKLWHALCERLSELSFLEPEPAIA